MASTNVTPTNMTVADYCQAMERGEIKVNREYQRNDKVWPDAARSFLIETVLLGYPMPKLALFQLTDIKTKKVTKEIVDGQQRSTALLEYYHNKYKLSRSLETEDFRGKTYDELEADAQGQFLNYSLSFDLLLGATPDRIREVFRRINSYTVPLNPEEQRHAEFQGAFKWFVYRIAQAFDENFKTWGLFSQKALVRMQDTKLIAEVVHALRNGIQTTKSRMLRSLYLDLDDDFADEDKFGQYLTSAFDQLAEWSEIHGTALMKPHQVYALTLALIHMRSPIALLEAVYPSPALAEFDTRRVIGRLTAMAAALDEPEPHGVHKRFVQASIEKTNVKAQRETRFRSFCKALQPREA